jgi:phosphonate dehydrogenase
MDICGRIRKPINMMDGDRPVVVVTHWVHPEVIAALERFCRPVAPAERSVVPRVEVLGRLGVAEGVLVCMADHVDEEFLAAAPRLRIVSAALKGYDNIDVAACTRRGVWLTILPGQLTAPAAELAVALILGLLRRVAEGDRLVRAGGYRGWRPTLYGSSLAGAAVGIIGMGAVGRAVTERLLPFGCRISYCDTVAMPADEERALGVRRLDLAGVLSGSDIVVPLVPLTRATYRMIDADALARMRPGCYLVNTCRGSVVDEEAVATALGSGDLAGYAADVFALEDWAVPDRPRALSERLRQHPRTLFTPHLGTAVDRVRREMSLTAARQVEQAFNDLVPEYAINRPDR